MCKNKRLRAACWFGTDKPDERFISFSILFLFFLTSALRRGKYSPSPLVPSGHQEKHFCFTFFKHMHFPVSSQACVDRADCAGAAHITSPSSWLQGFIILHLVVNTTLTSSKARNSFFSLRSYQEFPPFLRCLRDRSADWTKARGQRTHIFICETNRPGVPAGYGKPWERNQPRHTPSSSAEVVGVCAQALQRCSESRDLGQAQQESHYNPIGVSCDLKDR